MKQKKNVFVPIYFRNRLKNHLFGCDKKVNAIQWGTHFEIEQQ